jgi:uncharacterized protein YbdZ (MbtH family)
MSKHYNQDTTIYKVVVNNEEQYSIWPVGRENAIGWRDEGKIGLKGECLEYIKGVWTDMRPLSLRNKELNHNLSGKETSRNLTKPIIHSSAPKQADVVSSTPQQKFRIFISYRRDDSEGYSGRLFDKLSLHFGKDKIFMDIDTIEPGEDFVEVIEREVGSCDILVAIIGKNWLSSVDNQGHRRIDNPEDFVRLEINTALERNIRVIPVLVQGTAMPQSDDLPDKLAKLTRRNAIELSSTRWQYDVERLIQAIEKILGKIKSA